MTTTDAPHAPQLPVKAEALTISKRMTIEQAFQAIAINCLTHMSANQGGAAQGDDAECLHQLRVGLRRLRTLFALFKDLLPAPALLQQELTWLGEQLGAARDWDVLATSTLPTLSALTPDEPGLEAVGLAALVQGRQQHALATAALNSARTTQLMRHCAAWIDGCGWRDGMAVRQRERLVRKIAAYARTTLQRQQRRLLQRGNKLQGANLEQRHRVRIAAKKMRYACEFFQTLYPQRKMAPYLAALTRLQDGLGWLNDAAVACALLGQLQGQRQELAGSAGFLRGYLAARLAQDGSKCARRWKKFAPIALPR